MSLMADEVELKLELTPEAADEIEASGLLAGDPETVQQKSIYFDTPDRDLMKGGLSLRVRQSDGRRVQTIKADGASAAGLFARSEWERPLEDDTPILDDTTPIPALPGDAADAIAPIFEVKIERRIWMISERDTTIELVLDRGEVVAGERRVPICEIELELKGGDPAGLFALARRIDAIVPVRLGVRTKAERGYALLGPAATMVKAEPVGLASDMTAAQAFRRIVQSCVRQFRLNEALLITGRDSEALHRARVALRRLRSALSIFKPMIGHAGADLREGLRWLASAFGDARNLDVLLERARPGPLQDRLAAAREAAYDRACDALSSSRARRLMLDLAEWTAGDDWLASAGSKVDGSQPARAFAAAALNRFRRKVRKAARDLAHADDSVRHEVRKDAKKLRYAAEFFASLFERKHERRRYKRFVVALEALQDRLGALNDLATAPGVLKELGIADDPDAAKLLAKGRKKSLIKRAEDARRDLFERKRFWE
jgi:triphosphatase